MEKGWKFLKDQRPFIADALSEDTDALFFDANGDGFMDLYVVSGGYGNYKDNDPLFQDRLYMNDGRGGFSKSAGALPLMHVSKSCARAGDFNGDGKPDLFIGGRNSGSRYPESPKSFLLINDGKGHFSDQIKKIAPDLEYIGMVTDAAVLDLDNDRKQDLVVIGDWMPVTAFINAGGKLNNRTDKYFDGEYSGWWNTLKVEDLNGDGRADLVLGNLGLNSQCRKSDAEAGLKEIFTAEELKGAKTLRSNYLKTAYFERSADGKFKVRELPVQAQFSPVYTITCLDYDGDGRKDLLLCGNINQSRIRFGKYDANHGVLLKGDGKGGFAYVAEQQSGLKLKGDVRSAITINNTLLIGINQQQLRAFRFNQK